MVTTEKYVFKSKEHTYFLCKLMKISNIYRKGKIIYKMNIFNNYLKCNISIERQLDLYNYSF